MTVLLNIDLLIRKGEIVTLLSVHDKKAEHETVIAM